MLDSRQCKEGTRLTSFPSSEVVWPPPKMLNAWQVHWQKTNENLYEAWELVLRNRRITIHEVVNMLGISYGSVQRILKDNVNTHPIFAKCLHCLLSEKQENCVHTCQVLLEAWKRLGIPFGDNHRWQDMGLLVQSRKQACHLSGKLPSSPRQICIKIIICIPTLIHWHITVPVDKCTMKTPEKRNFWDSTIKKHLLTLLCLC